MRFPWNHAESQLEREIAHHLHHLAAEYERQGYSREEALRLARREFGGSEQVKEQCREEQRWAWLIGLRQDLVFGFRMMRRTPAVTAAAVLSLALGIGANTAIVSLMDVVLWRELPVLNPKQLSLVHWTGHGIPRELAEGSTGSILREEGGTVADFFSFPSFQRLRKSVAPQVSLAAYEYPSQVSVSFAGRPIVAEQRRVSGNFFSTLLVRSQLGRLLSDADDRVNAPAAVVVSHRFWRRALGSDPHVIGRTLSLNGKPFVIAGVLDRSFTGLVPADATEIYAPMHRAPRREGEILEDNRRWIVSMIARRASGVTNAQVETVMNAVFPTTWSRPLKDASKTPHIRLDDGSRGLGFLRREFRNPLMVLGGLVILLLVIACTNIANLLLARATARQKEIATRVSLGCSQGRLMRQFLTESAMLAMLGGAASIAVAYGTANLLGRYLAGRDGVPIAVALDARILTAVGVITAVALLLFGLLPAWKGSRLADPSWLKEGAGSIGTSSSRRGWNMGRALVLGQMAMSVVLVMAAVIFTRNLMAIESGDPGWDRRNLILFGLRPGTSGYDKSQLPGFFFQLERRLAEMQGVAGAGLVRYRPMNIGGWWEGVRLVDGKEITSASVNGVTPNYLPLYTQQVVVAGRHIRWPDITSEAKVAVISEDLAQKLGGRSVIGRKLQFSDGSPNRVKPEFEIVGIAPAFAATSMKERPFAVWLPLDKSSNEVTVVLRTSQPPQRVLPSVRRTMSEIDRNLPLVDVITMEEQISKGLQRERMFATLCNGFGTLALMLSVVGLYGVIAYSTSRRRREIGVRLALGALPGNVVSMVFREGLMLVIAGMISGIFVVWLGTRYLEKELYRMKALEPVSFVLALGIMFLAALIAVGIPAFRAASMHPAETLRQE